jgi:acyl dehydratase
LKAGDSLPTIYKDEITHTQLVRYAGASGDFNPIHTVVPYAEQAGLGGVIAHGMLIMGFVGQAIGTWFHADNLVAFSVRFRAITRPGEKISVRGSIKEETDQLWIIEAVAINEHDEVKLTANVQVRK